MNPATSKKLRVFLLVSAAIALMLLLAGGCLVLLSAPVPADSSDGDETGREQSTLSRHMTRLKIAGQFIWYDTLDALSRAFGGKSDAAAEPTEQYEEPAPVDDSAVSELSRRSR